MSAKADYSTVTEIPGQGATSEQLSALVTRYRFAADHCHDKDVLEVACGSGNGLGYLSRVARRVVGGDIEPKNVEVARAIYADDPNIEVCQLDALNLPFEENHFDVLLLFEAIYYLPDAVQFLTEARRVLRPGGKLLISTVHPDWDGFNPSPFSVRYFSYGQLSDLLQREQLDAQIYAAFSARSRGLASKAIQIIRRLAVKLKMVPKTMRGKEQLKRLFYGRLKPLPAVVTDDVAAAEPMITLHQPHQAEQYKFLYIVAENRAA